MNREKVITLRVSDEERDSYKSLAGKKGKKLGEYIRFLLDREIILMGERDDKR